MPVLYARKEVATLPVTLQANCIYAIRSGRGFDLYISDSTGSVAHKLNNTDNPLKSPVFTYTSGKLTGISYSDGSTKILQYTSGILTRLDLLSPTGYLTRKDFTYSSGVLSSITESNP
jgi:hypothetical protein